MRTVWRIGVLLAAVLWAAACGPTPRPDRATRQLLLELDGYISASNMYVARKLDQMDALGKLARSTRDPLRRYELEMNIAREFFAFSFDSTQFYLKHCQELAQDVLEDQDLYNETSVQLGHLYAKAGSYLEASQLLYGGLDTASFSRSLMAEYVWDLYDFSKDLAGNSGMVEKLSMKRSSSSMASLAYCFAFMVSISSSPAIALVLLPSINNERTACLSRDKGIPRRMAASTIFSSID